MKEVEDWPQYNCPGHLLSDVKSVPHLSDLVDRVYVPKEEEPIHRVECRRVYANEPIEGVILVDIGHDWEVAMTSFLVLSIHHEKETDTCVALVDRDQCLHERKDAAHNRQEQDWENDELESFPEKVLLTQFTHLIFVLSLIVGGIEGFLGFSGGFSTHYQLEIASVLVA